MNRWQAGTFGGLVIAMLTYGWMMLKPLITGDVVMAALVIVAIIAIVCLCGWFTRWGVTQPVKKYLVPPFALYQENTAGMNAFQLQQAQARYDLKTNHWKFLIFVVAMAAGVGGCEGALYGISKVLFGHLTPQQQDAYRTLGWLETAIVSASSPWMWKVVFEIALPLLFRKSGGAVEGRWDTKGNLIGAKDVTQPDSKTQLFQTPQGKGAGDEPDTH